MSEPFLGEIRIMGFNFAPRGWATCDGQILPIAQNTALFALLGTNFGGNGQTTFGLPDFRGRMPMAAGQSPGLSPYVVGEAAGVENVALLLQELPAHNHGVAVTTTVGTVPTSNGNQLARAQIGNAISGITQIRVYSSGQPNVPMSPNVLRPTGGSQPHNNMMPYLGLTFCIAMAGIFPPRG